VMFQSNGPVTLADIGPVRIGEPQLSRRIRVHQAWYRYSVLGEPDFGATPPPTSRPLGSILTSAAASKYLNLIGPASIDAYEERRGLGWGVDPVRTLGYLTSSQALTMNVFGALQANLSWCSAVMKLALPPDSKIRSVLGLAIEYSAPFPSQALGDRTIVDVLVRAETADGPLVVAIETKLGDRFNSRRVRLGRAYQSVEHLWIDPQDAARQEFSQLARAHALAEHASLDTGSSRLGGGRLLLLHHPQDVTADAIGRAYSAIARAPQAAQTVALDHFLSLMRQSAPNRESTEMVEELKRRYVDMSESEQVWREFLETVGPRKLRG
jgi:hypothetical protein